MNEGCAHEFEPNVNFTGVRQPNYSYLPSDLSHMGSNQRSNLWLQWCNQAKFSEIDGLMQISIWKLMDSSTLASKIDGLTQFLLSK